MQNMRLYYCDQVIHRIDLGLVTNYMSQLEILKPLPTFLMHASYPASYAAM